jgi:hypothetical protein
MKRALPLVLTLFGPAAIAAEHQHNMHPPASACADVALSCADKATPFLEKDGVLWLAWSANGRVAVMQSKDLGKTFSPPQFVNTTVEKLDGGADSRPQIIRDATGKVVVAYSVARDANYNGEVLTAVSSDGLKPFSAPKPLTDSKVSQRFVAFAMDSSGDVFSAWIDKRNLAAAKVANKKYSGAALAFSWAKAGSFADAKIAQDNTCECCRLGIAFAGPRRPAVIWRNLYPGGVRDHAVTTFDGDKHGPVSRVAEDNWKIDACPHQGPALAIGQTGTYHAAWFTEGAARQGVFYARSRDGGLTFDKPIPVGNVEQQPSRPYIFAAGKATWLAWKEFDGENSVVMAMVSQDDGATWSKPKSVAQTAAASDHPLMVGLGDRVYISWLTRAEGYRLIPIESR